MRARRLLKLLNPFRRDRLRWAKNRREHLQWKRGMDKLWNEYIYETDRRTAIMLRNEIARRQSSVYTTPDGHTILTMRVYSPPHTT